MKEIVPLINKGWFLSISGELGVGKTTLVQALCQELNIREKITSPTFTILKRYWSEEKKCFINHFDFFRIGSEDDLELFHDMKNDSINIVEWPEKAPLFFSERKTIKLRISFCRNGRKIEVFSEL